MMGERRGGGATRRADRKAGERSREDVRPPNTDRDALARHDRKRTLLELRPSGLEQRRAVAIGACEEWSLRGLIEADAGALERAGEENLLHDAAGEVGRG